jgi:uncharacterized protein (TIGR02452 family)
MGRYENIAVFQDTEKLVQTHEKLAAAVAESNSRQRLIAEKDTVAVSEKLRYEERTTVVVSKKRTLEAAQQYGHSQVCVLNFASAINPGGGVVHGSSAQEECLCRCSTLYFNLHTEQMWQDFYMPHRRKQNPLHNDDCIYTPGGVVFKTDTKLPKLLPEGAWYQVNAITCAAPNLREKPENAMNPGDGSKSMKISNKDLLMLHEKRARRILDIAVANENDVLILGAFGCGAFSNPPGIVARAMAHVLPDYLHAFRVIEFAVYCSPRDEQNYEIFKQEMKPYMECDEGI